MEEMHEPSADRDNQPPPIPEGRTDRSTAIDRDPRDSVPLTPLSLVDVPFSVTGFAILATERLGPPIIYATILFALAFNAERESCSTIIGAVDEILAPRLFTWLLVAGFLFGGIRALLLKWRDFHYPRLTLLFFTSLIETAHQALSLLLGAVIPLTFAGGYFEYGFGTAVEISVFFLLFYIAFTLVAAFTLQAALGVGAFAAARQPWLGWVLAALFIGFGLYGIRPALDAMQNPVEGLGGACERNQASTPASEQDQ
jgi:hypothetical protein